MSRFARAKDANHKAIVEALRKVGCSAHGIEGDAPGCPDILVGKSLLGGHGVTYLLEVKTGKGHHNQRTLEAQLWWRTHWKGGPLHIVHSVDEALAAVGIRAGERP